MTDQTHLAEQYEQFIIANFPADQVRGVLEQIELRAKYNELTRIQTRKATQARARKRAKEKAETDALIAHLRERIATLEAQAKADARTIARLDAHIALFDKWVKIETPSE